MAKQLNRHSTRALRRKTVSGQMRSKKLEVRFESLSAITRQITQLQETDRLLAMILEEASRLLRAEGVGIRVVVGDELRLLARTEAAKDVMIQPSIKVGESLTGRVALENRPLAVYDLATDSRHIPEHNRPAVGAGFRSFLGVPFRSQDKVIGTLSILTKEHRHFSQEEIDLVSAFADQAAVAIQNARLFEESNRRREQAEALREIGLSLTATHNPQQVLDQVAEEARRLVGALFTFVAIPDNPFYRFVAVAGDDQGYRHVLKLSDDPASPYGQGPLGRAIRSRKSVVCEDVLSDPLFVTWREIASERGIRSLVAVPLLVQEKPYGAMLVYSPIPRAYEAETLNLLELLAAQAGAALENARLYQESQQQQEVQRLLKELSQDITSLDIDSLLKKLTQKVREFFKVDISDVRILEDGRWQVMGVSGTDPERVQSDSTGTARGRSKWILQNRKPLLIPDITEGEGFSGGESIRKAGIRGYLAVPLFLRDGEVIGILRALTYEPREFSQSEVDLLQQLANGAAIALENARLYEETERRRREAEELARVARSLTETMDMTAIAERVVTSVREILDVKTSTLRLLQPDGSLRALASRGEGSPRSPGGGQTVPSGMGLTGRAIAEGKPVWSADMLNDPKVRLTDQMRDSQLRSGNSSMIAVPLRAREKTIGALALSDQKGRIYSDSDVALVQTFADQAALALENARLYEEMEHRAREQEALSAIATATSQSLRIDEVLQIALDKVLAVTGREQGYIRLKDPVTGNLTLAAHRGISEKYVQTLLHERTPGGKSDQVFESGEPLVVNDPAGSLLKEATRREGSRAMSWFPLKVRGRAVGIINVSTTRPIPFQPREVELLKAIGNVIGVALENARLYEHAKQQALELEKANKIKDEFLGFISHELRTPLNAVIAYTVMMQDRLLGEVNREQEETLAKVFTYSKDLMGMIDSLLEVTRMQAGRVGVEIHKVDLERFLEDLKSSYDFPTGKPVTFSWEFPAELPTIRTDGEKLRHILQNLINNAIKYTDKGTVKISVRKCPERKRVELEVADTGVGIPHESLPHIFEMFHQVKGAHGKSSAGVGLGLHIVKKFTEMLAGEIAVESEVGKGSTFTVTIPSDRDDSSTTAGIPA